MYSIILTQTSLCLTFPSDSAGFRPERPMTNTLYKETDTSSPAEGIKMLDVVNQPPYMA